MLDGFLQTAGCIYAQKAGQISCIQRAAPRTSIVTISAEDTAGPLEIDTAASRINRINTLRPRFWSEGNRWQMTAVDEVTASTWQTEDGGKRTRPLDFPFVPSATQCAQLAALQIANTREGITGVIPLKPHLQRITPGDAFTITEAGFILNGLKCLCLNTEYDPATGVHRVTFVSETDGKYSFALGQSPSPPASPTLTPVDPTYVTPPGTGDWTVTPRPPGDGGGLPVFDVTGVVNNATATGVIVEWGLTSDATDAGNWRQAYEGPPTATNIPLVGIEPGTDYYVAVRYRRGSNYSDRQVYGPYTAPALVAGDTNAVGGTPAEDLLGFFRDVSSLPGQADLAAETLIRETLDRHERVVAEEEARIVGLQAEASARGTAIAGVNSSITTVATDLSAEITTRTTQYAATSNAVALVSSNVTTVASNLAAETSTRTTQISAVNASIAAVDTRVTTTATDLTALTSSVTTQFSTVNGTLASHTSSITTNATAISAETSTRTTQISAVNASIASVDTRVTTVASDLSAETSARLAYQSSTTSGLATINSSLTTLSNAQTVQAGLITTAQTTANGASSSATLALSALNGNEAYIALMVDVANRITGQRINGATGTVDFLAENFRISTAGTAARTEYADGIWHSYSSDNTVRSSWGKPFGGTQGLCWWTGPNSVAKGSETKANAYVYISTNTTDGGRFGGSDVGTGAPPSPLDGSWSATIPTTNTETDAGTIGAIAIPAGSWRWKVTAAATAFVNSGGVGSPRLARVRVKADGVTIADGTVQVNTDGTFNDGDLRSQVAVLAAVSGDSSQSITVTVTRTGSGSGSYGDLSGRVLVELVRA